MEKAIYQILRHTACIFCFAGKKDYVLDIVIECLLFWTQWFLSQTKKIPIKADISCWNSSIFFCYMLIQYSTLNINIVN